MKGREGSAQSHILQDVYVEVSQRGRVREANRQYLMRERGGERGVQGTVQFKQVKSRYRKSIGFKAEKCFSGVHTKQLERKREREREREKEREREREVNV